MNVFKNKKRWKKIKKTLKNVKTVPWIKKRKNVFFYIYGLRCLTACNLGK